MRGHMHVRSQVSPGMDCSQDVNHRRTLGCLGIIQILEKYKQYQQFKLTWAAITSFSSVPTVMTLPLTFFTRNHCVDPSCKFPEDKIL